MRRRSWRLNHGADDYLTKPFSTGELAGVGFELPLRHAVARTIGRQDVPVFESGDLKIDLVDAATVLSAIGGEAHADRI